MDLRYFVEPLKIYGSGGQRRWQYAVRDRQSNPTDNDGHYEKIALVYEPSMAERLAALLNAPDEARWQATLDHANEQTTKERVRADLLAAELIAARAELAAANDLHRGAKERAGMERLRGDIHRDKVEELTRERDEARAKLRQLEAERARSGFFVTGNASCYNEHGDHELVSDILKRIQKAEATARCALTERDELLRRNNNQRRWLDQIKGVTDRINIDEAAPLEPGTDARETDDLKRPAFKMPGEPNVIDSLATKLGVSTAPAGNKRPADDTDRAVLLAFARHLNRMCGIPS